MEKDLFIPIKSYFEKSGYVCDGEVNGIDLYMEKEGSSVAVELKVSLDFKALQQAALRQKICDAVYIGIFKPSNIRSGSFNDKLYLLKRLGIGLIVVSKRSKAVEIVSEPIVCELSSYRSKNIRKHDAVSREFQKRKTKSNIGGVTQTKLITSYREDALLVLDAMAELGGQAGTRTVHKYCNIKKTADILRSNYYGWFEKIDSSLYSLTDAGYAALEEYEEVLSALRKSNTPST